MVAGLVPLIVTALLLVAGCGSESRPRADVPPVKPSHFTFDRELTEAGVSSQMVQSLSETAQSAAYDRDEFALTSSRASQDLALLALHRCRADAAGRRTFAQYVADDERRGIPKAAAVSVNHFIGQGFCPPSRVTAGLNRCEGCAVPLLGLPARRTAPQRPSCTTRPGGGIGRRASLRC